MKIMMAKRLLITAGSQITKARALAQLITHYSCWDWLTLILLKLSRNAIRSSGKRSSTWLSKKGSAFTSSITSSFAHGGASNTSGKCSTPAFNVHSKSARPFCVTANFSPTSTLKPVSSHVSRWAAQTNDSPSFFPPPGKSKRFERRCLIKSALSCTLMMHAAAFSVCYSLFVLRQKGASGTVFVHPKNVKTTKMDDKRKLILISLGKILFRKN